MNPTIRKHTFRLLNHLDGKDEARQFVGTDDDWHTYVYDMCSLDSCYEIYGNRVENIDGSMK